MEENNTIIKEEITKPNNKKYVIVIILLSLLVVASCGFIAYDKLIANDNKDTKENKEEEKDTTKEAEEDTKEEKETSLLLSNPVVKKIYSQISEIDVCDSPMVWDFINKNKINVDSLTKEEIYKLMLRSLEARGHLNFNKPKTTPEFTLKDFADSYKAFIGKTESDEYISNLLEEITKDNSSYNGYNYNFDKGNSKIIGVESPTGCVGPGIFVDFLYDAKLIDGNYILYVKVATDTVDENGYQYASLTGKPLCLVTDVENCWDKMTTYKYTFKPVEIDRGTTHYNFVSVELVE